VGLPVAGRDRERERGTGEREGGTKNLQGNFCVFSIHICINVAGSDRGAESAHGREKERESARARARERAVYRGGVDASRAAIPCT